MGLFDFLKKEKIEERASNSQELHVHVGEMGGMTPTYYPPEVRNSEISEAAATCIMTNATHFSKINFYSCREIKGDIIRDYPKLDRLLGEDPNPLQTASVFWEKIAWDYWENNNAFIHIERDPITNEIIALWPIAVSGMRFKKIRTGEVIFEYSLNGKEYETLYTDLIHLARFVNADMVFGNTMQNNIIQKVLKIINLNYDGIENAILTSTFIRYIAKVNTRLNKAELKKMAKKFTEDYLNIGKKDQIGAVFTDTSWNLEVIPAGTQKTGNYAEVNQWNQAVYKYYGCPEKVICGVANEDEMESYYKSTIVPLAIRVRQEMTRKLFTKRERDVGNSVRFTDMSMEYRSMTTRLRIFEAAKELGLFTKGVLGDLIGLPVPKGEREVVVTSQNYQGSLDENNNPNPKEEPKENPKEGGKQDGNES